MTSTNAIDTKSAFNEYFKGKQPDKSEKISDILDAITKCAQSALLKGKQEAASKQAVANARGTWFEWILSILAWNVLAVRKKDTHGILLLPNKTQLQLPKLFTPEVEKLLQDLYGHLRSHDAELETSNPDLLIVAQEVKALGAMGLKTPLKWGGPDTLQVIESAHKQLLGKLEPKDLKAGIGVKVSTRPDRRLQLVHEGNVVKALVAHLQTRVWDTSFRTRYFVVKAEKVQDAERDVLRSAAVHSIVDVHIPIERSVDQIFGCETVEELLSCIENMIKAADE